MKIYLVRHGESNANLESRHAGWWDAVLTEKGEEDACRAGELIRHIPFDKVYVSDLTRAMQTQKLALPEIEGEPTEFLREINVGSLGGRLMAECTDEYGAPYLKHREILDFTAYGGENWEQLRARMAAFLRKLEQCDYEKVALFFHGCAMQALILEATGIHLPCCANGAVTVLEWRKQRWRLRLWNYTGNLE